MLPVPSTLFADMPGHVACSGSPALTGNALQLPGGQGAPQVKSIAEVHDKNGVLVGWIYLSGDLPAAEYVQGNSEMTAPAIKLLRLMPGEMGMTSVSKLTSWPANDLRAMPCAAVEQPITD